VKVHRKDANIAEIDVSFWFALMGKIKTDQDE